MLGVILCGGQSLRMGSDKGLLTFHDKLWAEIAYDKLSSLNFPVKLSVNPAQLQDYSNHFLREQLIVDHPSLVIKGPLLGVLSAHLLAPAEDLFLLACDMLLVKKRLIKQLLDSMLSDDTFDAYIFTRAGQQEPLCGIYRSGALKRTMDGLLSQGIAKPSMKFMLSNLQVLEIPLKIGDYPFFSNFNSQVERDAL
jgi:molybdopterin-guanine dinucleotide biosynthesis protein A